MAQCSLNFHAHINRAGFEGHNVIDCGTGTPLPVSRYYTMVGVNTSVASVSGVLGQHEVGKDEQKRGRRTSYTEPHEAAR